MSRSSKILLAYQKRPADAGLGVVGVWVVSTGVLHMTETEMQKALRQNVRSCSITQKNSMVFLRFALSTTLYRRVSYQKNFADASSDNRSIFSIFWSYFLKKFRQQIIGPKGIGLLGHTHFNKNIFRHLNIHYPFQPQI
jgi:hypothetical protein